MRCMKSKSNIAWIEALVGYVLFCVAICLYTFSKILVINNLTFFLATFCAVTATYHFVAGKNNQVVRQLIVLYIVSFVMLLSIFTRSFHAILDAKTMFPFAIILIGLSIALYMTFLGLKKGKVFYLVSSKDLLKNVSLLFLILVITVIFLFNYKAVPRWDTHYVIGIASNDVANLFNLCGIRFVSILRGAYRVIESIAGCIFQDALASIYIVNYILLVGSVCAVNGIIKLIFPEKSSLNCTLLTGIYAFSPYILGLSSYCNWDYWAMLLFPLAIYFYLKRDYVYHFVFAICFIYVKESCVFAYAGFCLGVIVYDFMKKRRLSAIIRDKRYWTMLILGVCAVVLYLTDNYISNIILNYETTQLIEKYRYTDTNIETFGVLYNSFPNIFERTWLTCIRKIKVMIILNFSWLLVGGSFVGIFYSVIKKREYLQYIVPIVGAEITFTIFSLWFVTYNHPRYMDSHVSSLLLLFIISLGMIEKKWIRNGIGIIISVIFLISNYYTIDPLSLKYFNVFNVGNRKIICTEVPEEILSDANVYNQQWTGFDKTLNIMAESLMERGEDYVLLVPQGYGAFYFYSNVQEDGEDGLSVAYYDTDRHIRYLESGTAEKIYFKRVSEDEDIASIVNAISDKEIYYCYLSFYGSGFAERLRDTNCVKEEMSYEQDGWIVECMHIDRKVFDN